jgi:hypothetical protein
MFSTQQDASFTADLRSLSTEEIDEISGGGGSSGYSSTYQGGNDGYGGSRRNP